MPRALFDTTVLYGAAYRPDCTHDDAIPLLRGVDTADLPEAVILDHVLAETLNGLTTHAGHDAAVDFLDRIEGNSRFHVESLTTEAFAAAKALFRRYECLSFVDARIAAYMRIEGIEYLYAFDDFDAVEDLTRLDTAIDPYQPE